MIVDADTDTSSQEAANSLLFAIGTSAIIGSGSICPAFSATGGTITGISNEITDGPFGNIAGGPFGVTSTAEIATDGRDEVLVTCNEENGVGVGRAFFPPDSISPGSGLVMYGGDISAIDLILAIQANNEKMYLNAIANRCVAAELRKVSLDIKPQSCRNPLNVKSKGVLPVAVLGTEELDAAEIDLATIELSGVPPIRWSYEDVSTPAEDGKECGCTTEGTDGFTDLTLKFRTQEIVEALGEVDDGDVVVLTLTGKTLDGTPIEGQDCLVIIKKGK